MIHDLEAVTDLAARGAIFYCSHSGGKDSQAMYLALCDHVPLEQIVVVHAGLGEVEWEGVQRHISDTIAHDLHVVEPVKTFFDMVERRAETRPDVPCWPSSATRQCTSDLKRSPIHKFIRNDMKARGVLLGVNCTGIRSAESNARAKKHPLKINATLSKAGREVWEYMPIFNWSTAAVKLFVKSKGQSLFWAYEGNERLSCVFCIMGSPNDLAHGAKHRPELLDKYREIETRTGWSFFPDGTTLDQKIAKALL